jgi:energy-coupling factor transporter ATP-binding protein EcfA2
MEDNLPLPMPDRTIVNNNLDKNQEYINKNDKDNLNDYINKSEKKFNELKESKLSMMSTAQIMQIEDMRQKILSYKLLSEKTIYLNSFHNNLKINKCNLIIFGPPGGGKTSFIKSLYQALYNNSLLSSDEITRMIIKKKDKKEDTLLFSQYNLVKETENNSGIMICDTSSHLKIDNNNRNKILLDGQLQDEEDLEKHINKNPKVLLEFWQKKRELFPKEIFKSSLGEGNIKSLPHSVIFVFDGNKEEIIDKKDIDFYKELVWISKDKGYKDIHVILTKVDEFEKNVWEINKNLGETEILSKLNTMKDIQIEKIISILGVNRSNVHFIENYHSDNQIQNSTDIDYNILKTIIDMLNTSELFILDKINSNQYCFGMCFY